MRGIVFGLLLVSVSASAQQLHTFENGEVADAQKINENFNYVLENASGGCSATQQDNTVLIECADGTSGVIASAGTVVVVPQGSSGEVPDISEIPVGDFYIVDGNGVVLSQYFEGFTEHPTGVSTTLGDSSAADISMRIHQVDADQSLYLVDCCTQTFLYYAELNCEGAPWTSGGGGAIRFDGQWWVSKSTTATGRQTLWKSYRKTDKYIGWEEGEAPGDWATEECVDRDPVAPVTIGKFPVPYDPPNEWLNAAYPLSLEQRP